VSSSKIFCNHHYREFIEEVGDMEGVQEIIDLSLVPHFTTLQKFLCRIKTLNPEVKQMSVLYKVFKKIFTSGKKFRLHFSGNFLVAGNYFSFSKCALPSHTNWSRE